MAEFAAFTFFNRLIFRALFSSTFTISIIADLLNKLKSNRPFTNAKELKTNIEPKIIIIKILDNKLFIGDQNNVTLAASFI